MSPPDKHGQQGCRLGYGASIDFGGRHAFFFLLFAWDKFGGNPHHFLFFFFMGFALKIHTRSEEGGPLPFIFTLFSALCLNLSVSWESLARQSLVIRTLVGVSSLSTRNPEQESVLFWPHAHWVFFSAAPRDVWCFFFLPVNTPAC